MHSLADIEDYEARYGATSEEGQGVIETLLDDASSLILEAVSGSTAKWVTDEDQEAPRGVIYVCVSAAQRVLERGDGIVREQLGEYAVSYRPDAPNTLWLTKQERRIVRKAAGLTSAQTVELVSPYSGDEAVSDMDFTFPLEEEGS